MIPQIVWRPTCLQINRGQLTCHPAGHILPHGSIEVGVNDDISFWEEPGSLEGHYANCFKVGYNAFEFVIDFAQTTGEGGRARLTSRILTNPGSAKALYETLRRSLEEYERTFGVIRPEKER